LEAKTVLVKGVTKFKDGGKDTDVHSLKRPHIGVLISKHMVLKYTNLDGTGLLGGLPGDMEVLTNQFKFSGQGRLLKMLSRRYCENSDWLSATGGSGLPAMVGIFMISNKLPRVPLRKKAPGILPIGE